MSARTVLVIPAWYPTEREPLAGPFVRDHARAAAAYGHRMVVLVDEGPSDARPAAGASSRGRPRRAASARPHDVPPERRSGSPGVLGALRVARRLRREGTPVDVLHAHIHRMGWVAVLAGTAAAPAGRHHRELERVAAPPDVSRTAAAREVRARARGARLPGQPAPPAGDRELRRAGALPDRPEHRRRERLPAAGAGARCTTVRGW